MCMCVSMCVDVDCGWMCGVCVYGCECVYVGVYVCV